MAITPHLSPTGQVVLDVVAAVGAKASKRFVTFFTDKYSQRAHASRVLPERVSVFHWYGQRGLSFERIESFHVAAYREHLLNHGAQAVRGPSW